VTEYYSSRGNCTDASGGPAAARFAGSSNAEPNVKDDNDIAAYLRSNNPKHLELLQHRIQRAIATQPTRLELAANRHPFKSVRFAIACAAALLIAISGFWFFRLRNDDSSLSRYEPVKNSRRDANSNATPSIATTDVRIQRALLEGFQDVYGKQIVYVSDIDGRLHVELDQQPASSASPNHSYIVVRFVLLSRKKNKVDAPWLVVHTANLLAGQEQQLEISDKETPLQISLWAFPVDADRVNLDLHGHWNLALPIELSQSELEKVGEAREIYSATHNGVEYRLYQTVLSLNEDSDSQVSSNGLTNAGGES